MCIRDRERPGNLDYAMVWFLKYMIINFLLENGMAEIDGIPIYNMLPGEYASIADLIACNLMAEKKDADSLMVLVSALVLRVTINVVNPNVNANDGQITCEAFKSKNGTFCFEFDDCLNFHEENISLLFKPGHYNCLYNRLSYSPEAKNLIKLYDKVIPSYPGCPVKMLRPEVDYAAIKEEKKIVMPAPVEEFKGGSTVPAVEPPLVISKEKDIPKKLNKIEIEEEKQKLPVEVVKKQDEPEVPISNMEEKREQHLPIEEKEKSESDEWEFIDKTCTVCNKAIEEYDKADYPCTLENKSHIIHNHCYFKKLYCFFFNANLPWERLPIAKLPCPICGKLHIEEKTTKSVLGEAFVNSVLAINKKSVIEVLQEYLRGITIKDKIKCKHCFKPIVSAEQKPEEAQLFSYNTCLTAFFCKECKKVIEYSSLCQLYNKQMLRYFFVHYCGSCGNIIAKENMLDEMTCNHFQCKKCKVISNPCKLCEYESGELLPCAYCKKDIPGYSSHSIINCLPDISHGV
eukprot:TRINITY_DN16927_c0_g1_i1.p1 TRINITY_DN16927_c0_g1~~TRINITY_DN16927_c0_g1_i1.p1  ORF type:complete len:535 (-),score=91.31 TRINITY_DN16927_c0_g1_i1:4-1551(-)